MATKKYARSPTIKRILHEAAELAQSPSPDFHAAPANDSDIFDWHFTVRGPPSSAFANGIYHGRIVLPPTYPLRPPSFRFLNSSGRFEVNREICLSISGHHEETWMPAWGVRTALVALRSFMETDPKGQLGGMECSTLEREKLARESVGWTCSVCQKKNEDILKESLESCRKLGLEKTTIETEENAVLQMRYKGKSRGTNMEKNDGILDETNTSETDDRCGKGPRTKPSDHTHLSTLAESSLTTPLLVNPSVARSSTEMRVQITHSHQTPPVVLKNDESPIWIDRAIATIIICLVAMVMKVLFGLGQDFSWESRQD